MIVYVLDSSAVLRYIDDEAGESALKRSSEPVSRGAGESGFRRLNGARSPEACAGRLGR